MIAEIAQCHGGDVLIVDDPGRGAREQYLSTVRQRAQPGGSMHRQAGVAMLGAVRIAGMEPHTDPDLHAASPGIGGERPLCGDCRRHRITSMPERHEERIPLRVHNDAAVFVERRTEHTAMFSQYRSVLLLQPLDKLCRAIDIGKEQRDGSVGQLGHCTPMLSGRSWFEKGRHHVLSGTRSRGWPLGNKSHL